MKKVSFIKISLMLILWSILANLDSNGIKCGRYENLICGGVLGMEQAKLEAHRKKQ